MSASLTQIDPNTNYRISCFRLLNWCGSTDFGYKTEKLQLPWIVPSSLEGDSLMNGDYNRLPHRTIMINELMHVNRSVCAQNCLLLLLLLFPDFLQKETSHLRCFPMMAERAVSKTQMWLTPSPAL